VSGRIGRGRKFRVGLFYVIPLHCMISLHSYNRHSPIYLPLFTDRLKTKTLRIRCSICFLLSNFCHLLHTKHQVIILTLLIPMSLVRTFPRHIRCLSPTCIQGYEQRRTLVSPGQWDSSCFELGLRCSRRGWQKLDKRKQMLQRMRRVFVFRRSVNNGR